MRISCPHCDATLEVESKFAGEQAICPQCNNMLIIPAPTATVILPDNPSPNPTPAQKQSVTPSEKFIASGFPRWWFSVNSFCCAGIWFVFAIFVFPDSPVSGLFFFLGIMYIIRGLWVHASQKYTLTSRNLTLVNGVIIKNEIVVRVSDIRLIAIKRTFSDYFAGSASLHVGTAGSADVEVKIKHIADAEKLRKILNQLRDGEYFL
ncbi:MAG: PH domain-containing protein [Victivallaceae bacterium]